MPEAWTPSNKRWYRPDEVAELVCVTTETVRRWSRTGKIKSVRVLGMIRIPREELERLDVVERRR